MNFYKYIISIHESHLIKKYNWINDFNNEVGSGFEFGIDGQLWDNKKPQGLYNFIDIKGIIKENQKLYNRILSNNKCPYIGDCIGIFTWEWYNSWFKKDEDLTYVTLNWADVAGGTIFRLDNQEQFKYITEVNYPLEEIQFKHGFSDGAAFLYFVKDHEEYMACIEQMITNHLNTLNLKGTFINYGTSHNPVKIYEEYSIEQFKNVSITFWGRNLGLQNNQNFISFLREY